MWFINQQFFKNKSHFDKLLKIYIILYQLYHLFKFIKKMQIDSRKRANSTQTKFRRWDKVIEPLLKFNRLSSNLGYPLDFVNQLEKIVAKGIEVKLNIPMTLSGAHDNFMRTIYKKNQQVGILALTLNISKASFDAQIQKQVNEKIQSLCIRQFQFKQFIEQKIESNSLDQTMPFAIIKQKTVTDSFSLPGLKSFILSKDEYKKLINIQANQIMQNFVYNNTSTVSITRFFYYPKKQTLSIAYKIDNHECVIKKRFSKSFWRVKNTNEHSFSFIKILHVNKSFCTQTIGLVKILQSVKKANIQKIVCDWIIDSTNRYVLFEVRQIKLQNIQSTLKINRDLSDVLALITCSVCQQKFQNIEINKLITHKLIWQFFQHLKKRKVELSFIPNYKYSSNTARVCDLCYMLVVSESKLIQLELTMGKATNSLQKKQSQSTRLLDQLKNNQPNQYKQKNLRQLYSWRLFFYVQDIKELSSLEQTFETSKDYYLMINLHNQITSFKLKNLNDRQNYSIKGLKISYLFSQTQKIQKFLNKSEIVIRITYQNNWNAVIAQGSSSSLYQESQKFSMRKFKQILLFNSKSKYCVLGLHLGIKLDGNYSTERLTLTKVYDAYLSNQKYINCLQIPPEWMQIIDPIYCVTNERRKKFQYQMNMNHKQIKNILPNFINTGKRRLVL